MLSAEEASRRLKEFESSPVPVKTKFPLLFPKELKSHVSKIFDLYKEPDTRIGYQTLNNAAEDLTKQVLQASHKHRQLMLGLCFPAIAAEVGYYVSTLSLRLPYTSGYTRRPFRSPNQVVTTAIQSALAAAIQYTKSHNRPMTWFAQWVGHMSFTFGHHTGSFPFLAASMDLNGREKSEVFQILADSVNGTHDVGTMGMHVAYSLAQCDFAAAWDLVEKMLLSAQRQEGLRSAILEAADFGQTEFFLRMLRVVLDENLLRFSSVVRAADVWFGTNWDSMSAGKVREALARMLDLLEHPAKAEQFATNASDPVICYFALWSLAFRDVQHAMTLADRLLSHQNEGVRFAAVKLLRSTMLHSSDRLTLKALSDPSIVVAAYAAENFEYGAPEEYQIPEVFDLLSANVKRFPSQPQEVIDPLGEFSVRIHKSKLISSMLSNAMHRASHELFHVVSDMNADQRTQLGRRMNLRRDAESAALCRPVMLQLAADLSPSVREEAFTWLEHQKPESGDAQVYESLLTRSGSELRAAVQRLLRRLPVSDQQECIVRLLGSKSAKQREAAVEMLVSNVLDNQDTWSQARLDEYVDSRKKLTKTETALLQKLKTESEAPLTLENGFGLYNPKDLRPAVKPEMPAVGKDFLFTPASVEVLKAMKGFIDANSDEIVVKSSWDGKQDEVLLGSMEWYFPAPKLGIPVRDQLSNQPALRALFTWWDRRPSFMRDADGLEALRALTQFTSNEPHRIDEGTVRAGPETRCEQLLSDYFRLEGNFNDVPITNRTLTRGLLTWLIKDLEPAIAIDSVLTGMEVLLNVLPDDPAVWGYPENPKSGWRFHRRASRWLGLLYHIDKEFHDTFATAQVIRHWRIMHWVCQRPGRLSCNAYWPDSDIVSRAFDAGCLNEAETTEYILREPFRAKNHYYSSNGLFPTINLWSGRRAPISADLRACVDKVRVRLLEIELQRGDQETLASPRVAALRYSGGSAVLLKALEQLGSTPFLRNGGYWGDSATSTKAILSHIVRTTWPDPEESLDGFKAHFESSKVKPQRLLDAAVFAPQWVSHAAGCLGVPGLDEAIFWFHAHTKDDQWQVEKETREAWAAEISERTPLDANDLKDGAVDVAWFNRVYKLVGAKHWASVAKAAKYASSAGGHKRAELFASAMLGEVDRDELLKRIKDKRHQDSVRALGLLPLKAGKSGEKDLLERYLLLQEFLRESKQFGSMRQASEKRAVSIGMDNLARTAGYADPLRLEWAMEIKDIQDLAHGPATAVIDDVGFSLSIDADGESQFIVEKAGKTLKSIPAKLKKHPEVLALKSRQKALTKQKRRMRESLEMAMCRGDSFTGDEISTLFGHPILRPMLEKLVVVGESTLGYPAEKGRIVISHDGSKEALGKEERVRVAHPFDLYQSGNWHLWQRDCLLREIVQPFKQVFRELYLLTDSESDEVNKSRRYAGNQVIPAHASALFRTRGWSMRHDEGISRTFHDEKITAWVDTLFDYGTAAETEGATVETVHFSKAGEWKPIPLADVPPRMFSEVMRDVDLVVSVAHAGGVDPESSASTVEMRQRLTEETCALLALKNVSFKSRFAIIKGEIANYNVHMGSGVCHVQPGGHICIIPVHAQHRGRLFLPFADNDPKTAEVISKILLLAEDRNIKDPSILTQIRQRPTPTDA